MVRKYSGAQILGFILSLIIQRVAVWFTQGFGSIHATYIWVVWIERKWQTHHGKDVTSHPPLIFSKEFEQRSRWKGNGYDGFFGHFDDNIVGGEGKRNTVGGTVDPEQARPVQTNA
ncbi:hypothetical protein EJ03DRAFT_349500 [Teratosphaeria nubilosa]|uniref:Uncharacterized protein n=1 Tax=Teratosphaeria nubilosa TaxID=161662 RepID=A0A6G1LF21_9PEZI|nr:hypothetical protein EJ03DRAFT_349500 [Teratosphaeria nubilosa]